MLTPNEAMKLKKVVIDAVDDIVTRKWLVEAINRSTDEDMPPLTSITEGLIWVSAYVARWEEVKGMSMTPLDMKVGHCVYHAHEVVSNMREGVARIEEKNRPQLTDEALEMMRHMLSLKKVSG